MEMKKSYVRCRDGQSEDVADKLQNMAVGSSKSETADPVTKNEAAGSDESRSENSNSDSTGSDKTSRKLDLPSIIPSSSSESNSSSDDHSMHRDSNPGSSADDHSVHHTASSQYLGDSTDSAMMRHERGEGENPPHGFLKSSRDELKDRLADIIEAATDSGVYICDKLTPSELKENGFVERRYRAEYEFTVLKKFAISEFGVRSVSLCQDKTTSFEFILKKIDVNDTPLPGAEFLMEHTKEFFLEIYGVHKEEKTISLFLEYIKDGAMLQCCWDFEQIRTFATTLLSAVQYIHSSSLVHYDIKLPNLLVRDPSRPESVVMIDFESAKHPQFKFSKTGYTFTHLPPWYEQIMKLNKFDKILKTADLYAVGCVITLLLIRTDGKSKPTSLWSDKLQEIKGKCKIACKRCCKDCEKKFLKHVRERQEHIITDHLDHLREYQLTDPNCRALITLVEYLTNASNIDYKHVDMAICIIDGKPWQPTDATFDHATNF